MYNFSKKKMTVELLRKTSDEWFSVIKSRRSSLNLEEVLQAIEWERYHIYKSTNKFRKSEREDVEQMKNASYIFFDKSVYSDVEIDEWIELLHKIDKKCFQYLTKPLPPKYVMNKIRIKK